MGFSFIEDFKHSLLHFPCLLCPCDSFLFTFGSNNCSFLCYEIQCKLSQYVQACIQLKIHSFLHLRPEDSSLGSGKGEGVMVYFFTIPFLHPISQGLFLLSQCSVWFSWLIPAGHHFLCYGWLFCETFLWAS